MNGKAVGGELFTISRETPSQVSRSFEAVSAKQAGVSEAWLQAAIYSQPEIVLGPCREYGFIGDELWFPWAREVIVPGVGSIDVLLVSSAGRLAIVETKLSYNREARREVLAQICDYAANLRDVELPPPPVQQGREVVNREEVTARLADDEPLLIVAGDNLDPRAVRLARNLLSDRPTTLATLAMIDTTIFRRVGEQHSPELTIVSHVRGAVVTDKRQVVKVLVNVNDTRVAVDVKPEVEIEPDEPGRRRWDAERFLSALDAAPLDPRFKDLARRVYALGDDPAFRVKRTWGTGKTGSMTLKRDGSGIIEVYLFGNLALRRDKVREALGQEAGNAYIAELEELFPELKSMSYPSAGPGRVSEFTEQVLGTLRKHLAS